MIVFNTMTGNCCMFTPCSEGDVHLLELVEAGQHTRARHAAENVGSGSLHQGHEALVPENLLEAVQRALVLGGASGCHHHAPPHGVDGVGHQPSSDSHRPSEEEGQSHAGISPEKQRLESVVEAEVHATVDEDTDGGDDEASVEALDTVRLQGLDVHVHQAVELPLASLALSVISKPGSGVVQRVDKHQREGTSKSSACNVGAEFEGLGSVLGGLEQALDLILEGKVQSLSGEVPKDVGEISSPEGVDSLGLQHPHGAVHHAVVRFVQTSLLDHLILVLDEKLHSLDGDSGGLGHARGHAGQHEVLGEPQLLLVSHVDELRAKDLVRRLVQGGSEEAASGWLDGLSMKISCRSESSSIS